METTEVGVLSQINVNTINMAPATEQVNSKLSDIFEMILAIETMRHDCLEGNISPKLMLDMLDTAQYSMKSKLLKLSNILPEGFGIADEMLQKLNRATLESKQYESFPAYEKTAEA